MVDKSGERGAIPLAFVGSTAANGRVDTVMAVNCWNCKFLQVTNRRIDVARQRNDSTAKGHCACGPSFRQSESGQNRRSLFASVPQSCGGVGGGSWSLVLHRGRVLCSSGGDVCGCLAAIATCQEDGLQTMCSESGTSQSGGVTAPTRSAFNTGGRCKGKQGCSLSKAESSAKISCTGM